MWLLYGSFKMLIDHRDTDRSQMIFNAVEQTADENGVVNIQRNCIDGKQVSSLLKNLALI